jgi:hypothetical protein
MSVSRTPSNLFAHFFFKARQPLGGPGRLVYRGFAITHFRHTTVGRTPLDEWPARRRDLYLTTHNTHKRQTSMLPAGFEPAIPASERPQTNALDRAATGIGTDPLSKYMLAVNWLVIAKSPPWLAADTLQITVTYFLITRGFICELGGII